MSTRWKQNEQGSKQNKLIAHFAQNFSVLFTVKNFKVFICKIVEKEEKQL